MQDNTVGFQSIEIAKKVFVKFDNVFHAYLMRGFQKYGRNCILTVAFKGRLRQGKNVLPDGLNWLCYFAGSSKSHRENSISSIFLESPHQVDMKEVVKCYKHFFGYFNALKTHSAKVGRFSQSVSSCWPEKVAWPGLL